MATTIVLNGPSSAGKSSLGAALQLVWDGPLLVTGIDSFLAGFPEHLFSLPGDDGSPGPATTGVHVVPGRGPAPSWVPALGADGHLLMRAAHRAWRAVAQAGLDQVIDHVILDTVTRDDALEVLSDLDVLWVGVHCDVGELVRREIARADRFRGFASGTWAQVHDGMTYDLIVDTSSTVSEQGAAQVMAALRGVPGGRTSGV
jgi:chloramphenicol 3-O phosphotransferase